jgi:hypothetical protein
LPGPLPTKQTTDFQVIHSRAAATVVHELPTTGVDKGELTSPIMSPGNTGLVDAIVTGFRECLEDRVRRDFNRRRRRVIRMAPSGYPERYWQKVVEYGRSFANEVVLLVPFEPIGRDISGWLYGHADNRPNNLRIEWLQGRQSGGGVAYDGTIEGIDVYLTSLSG